MPAIDLRLLQKNFVALLLLCTMMQIWSSAMRMAQHRMSLEGIVRPLSSTAAAMDRRSQFDNRGPSFGRGSSFTGRFDDRRGGDRRGGDRRGDNRGGRGGFRSGGHPMRREQDPFEKLNFAKTIQIDPDQKVPFKSFKLSQPTLTFLEKKGFEEMTPVQSQSFQDVFDGKDVVARSRTGTGKTLAFGLPIIERIAKDNLVRTRDLPVAVILEPTRELAVQVAQELAALGKPHGIRVASIYGGVSFGAQVSEIRGGVHIVVGTPGRMLDHISRGTADFGHVRHFVLDEGDTMLEMGFQKDVDTILQSVKSPGARSRKLATQSLAFDEDDFSEDKPHRFEDDGEDDLDSTPQNQRSDVQMMLFSATMPSWICKITDKMMKDPVFFDAVQEGETRLANTITHYAIPLPSNGNSRIESVVNVLEDVIISHSNGGQCIVFANFKSDCDTLLGSRAFSRLRAHVLHGDISQASRMHTLNAFKNKHIDVLIATDVAARGLDIANVDLVVHTSLPNDADAYVHRSGRTGRAGRTGTAVLLHTPPEVANMRLFQSQLNFKFNRASLPQSIDIVGAYARTAEAKIANAPADLARNFLPFAKKLLEKAAAGKLLLPPAAPAAAENATDAEAEVEVAGEPMQPEEVLARAMAAMSGRRSVVARSMLTSEEGKVTLTFRIKSQNLAPPQSVSDFQRVLNNVFSKRLEMPGVTFGRALMGNDDENDKSVAMLYQDVESGAAEEIINKVQSAAIAGLTVERSTNAPSIAVDSRDGGHRRTSSFGNNRSYGDRHHSGGGDRFRGGRQDHRSGGGRSWESSSSYRGGSSRGSW